MVNIEIPKNYTASPSSFSGTPHLTINRDVTVDLDSTNAFEGMLLTRDDLVGDILTWIQGLKSYWKYGSALRRPPFQQPLLRLA